MGCDGWLTSPYSPCLNKRTPQSRHLEFPEPAGWSESLVWGSHAWQSWLWPWFWRSLHAQMLSLAQYWWITGFAVISTWITVLPSYCFSWCNNPDNHTPDPYLWPQYYLEINCLSLKLLIWCLLLYLEPVTWWGHLKPLHATAGWNPRYEGGMQHAGAGGSHNPSVPKTSQHAFDEDIGFNSTTVIHTIWQFIFI